MKKHMIKIVPDDKGGFKASYKIGGFPMLTKRFSTAIGAAVEAATAIWTDAPSAKCEVEDNETWNIKL